MVGVRIEDITETSRGCRHCSPVSGHTCVMPPVFRRAVALVVLALATPGAQQREAGTESQQPTFRAGVNVVRVDVS